MYHVVAQYLKTATMEERRTFADAMALVQEHVGDGAAWVAVVDEPHQFAVGSVVVLVNMNGLTDTATMTRKALGTFVKGY